MLYERYRITKITRCTLEQSVRKFFSKHTQVFWKFEEQRGQWRSAVTNVTAGRAL